MDVEQYAWATEELVHDAEDFVGELEEELRRNGQLALFFIPLADNDPSGDYRIGPETLGFICYADGSMEWHFPTNDAAFVHYEQECRSASSTLQSYLIRLVSYALAHGMDIAKADATGGGHSILHAFEHEDVHTDTSYEN
jgi:hypothetical protein